MITRKFQIILIIVVVSYLVIVFNMLKKKVTLLKYTLLWMGVGVVMLVFAIFPTAMQWLANLIGIYADTNFLFLAIIAFTLMLVFSLTHVVSRLSENNKRLVQEIAILEKRVQELEKKR